MLIEGEEGCMQQKEAGLDEWSLQIFSGQYNKHPQTLKFTISNKSNSISKQLDNNQMILFLFNTPSLSLLTLQQSLI